jgi:PAS domain S-box-containing protein
MSNRAQDVLSKTVLRVDAAEPFSEKLAEIRRRRASHVAIFAHGRCLGVSSFSNAVFSSNDATFGELIGGQRSVNVSDATSVEELSREFADSSIEAQVVQDELGEFVGVVTRQSLLEALLNEREQSTEMLQSREAYYETILDAAPQIIWQGNADGTVKYVNQAWEDITGMAKENALGSGWASVIHPADAPELLAEWERACTDGKRFAGECRFLCKDGSYHTFDFVGIPVCDSSGKITSWVGIDTDITERKKAEEALVVSETRNRTLLDGSPVCTKIIDLDSKLQYMSCAGQSQLKISDIEPFYGSTFPPELYPDPMKKLATEHLERAKRGETTTVECCVLDTEGSELWYDTTFVPAHEEDGRIQYVIVISVNITERKRAEEQTRKLQDELAHVSRLSTMGEMATGIAHELNQPLAAISSYSFTARAACEKLPSCPPEVQQILGKLEDQSIRAGDIVRRLRDFVTKTESARVRADLNTIIREVISFVEPDIREADVALRLNLEANESPTFIVIDKIQIQQVLVNLIKNALDAMKETPTETCELIVSTQILQDDQVEVSVSDTGKGLTQEELEQVFGAFFSTKQEGMGMGLPISRSIIEAHNGEMWSKSKVGCGATFGFNIPRESIHETDQNPTVFIVDDEPAMRDSLRMVVQASGISAKCFSSAVEFLDVIEIYDISHSVCVIADVQMPKISGIELLSRLKALNDNIPVILMTGHATEALKQTADEAGAVAVLEKPFRPDELKELVTASLASTMAT